MDKSSNDKAPAFGPFVPDDGINGGVRLDGPYLAWGGRDGPVVFGIDAHGRLARIPLHKEIRK